jgi:hypothetical protein
VKLVRVLRRLALILLAAAAFAGLTVLLSRSVRSPLRPEVYRVHRRSEPEVSQFPELIAYVVLFVFWAVIGRIALRLRLSPPPRGETQPISLGLRRGRGSQAS